MNDVEINISREYIQTEEYTSKPNIVDVNKEEKRKLNTGRTKSNIEKLSSKKKEINFKKLLGCDARFMHKKINSMMPDKKNKVDCESVGNNLKITLSLKMDKFVKKDSDNIVNNVNININNHYILNTDENEQIQPHKANILRYHANRLNRLHTPIDNTKISVFGNGSSSKQPLYRTTNKNLKNKSCFTNNSSLNNYKKIKNDTTNKLERKLTHHSEYQAYTLANNNRVNTCPSQEKQTTNIDKLKVIGLSQLNLKRVFTRKDIK
jgi:hypothetical protein